MDEVLKKIEEAIYGGEEESVSKLVQEALDTGNSPHGIIESGVIALDRLGTDFDNLVAFLPDLMIAGDCMKILIELVTPRLNEGESAYKGKVVIGCAKGDLHDIGKSLVATQLSVNGFQVVDLGVDVATNTFIDTAETEKADIVAVSSLLTTSQYYMEELIKRFTHEGKRDRYRIAVGGGPINAAYAEKIGADGYSRTAHSAVKMAERLMRIRPGQELVVELG
ncbi:MAG: cobalamin-dependent protein [Spirochaetaceae bacterium]|jgi:5-methyltetrahydrofolate--homocysteine methyltransferase|nr:cobalamin-dependent protein [Spirochaetaceae bacterium]